MEQLALPGGKNGTLEVTAEGIQYKRYLSVFNRTVKYPPVAGGGEEKSIDFDVVGHPRCHFKFGVIFPYHPQQEPSNGDPPPPEEEPSDGERVSNRDEATEDSVDGEEEDAGAGDCGGDGVDMELRGSVTLIREYCQGPNSMNYSLPTGGFDPRKHANMEDCVSSELTEEAHLVPSSDIIRLIPSNHPGIPESKWCLNRFVPFLSIDPQPDPNPPPRDAEEIIEVVRVDISELEGLMLSGDMMPPSIVTCTAALKYLNEHQKGNKRKRVNQTPSQ
mmetsp:Transcript_40364/g.48931  ORF Transcript_40364/g.48931 Transcript_40364/m.48931 type:complete len:275 (+) Transcript_40364:80-904(+)